MSDGLRYCRRFLGDREIIGFEWYQHVGVEQFEVYTWLFPLHIDPKEIGSLVNKNDTHIVHKVKDDLVSFLLKLINFFGVIVWILVMLTKYSKKCLIEGIWL